MFKVLVLLYVHSERAANGLIICISRPEYSFLKTGKIYITCLVYKEAELSSLLKIFWLRKDNQIYPSIPSTQPLFRSWKSRVPNSCAGCVYQVPVKAALFWSRKIIFSFWSGSQRCFKAFSSCRYDFRSREIFFPVKKP